MPSTRSRASFEPIAPDFDVRQLVEETPNFQYVDRIWAGTIDEQGIEAFDKLVLVHVILGGKPLVIDGYNDRLDEWTFSSKWLMDNHGEKRENARDLTRKEALPLTVGHYLRNMSLLTDQFFDKPQNWKDKARQRIYLKDIDCPAVWQDKLREALPVTLFYMNESVGALGGPGSEDEPMTSGGKRRGRGIAPAGDLMSSLPPAMRAENLMCYIGHEGTYTPAHREMCASLGHNIMVEASEAVSQDGKPEKPGSSIWFMTESKDRQTVSEYWLSILGHDIETENHFAQIAAWKSAPFPVYIVDQRPGDFILIPPLAPHQVWNRGTRTMKVAWNRTTVETLDMALKEALPKARLVCRDEQYKNKAIIFYTLQKYTALVAKARDLIRTASSPQEQHQLRTSPRIKQLQKDFKRLFSLFKDILCSEMFDPKGPSEKNIQFFPYDGNITCAYCRGNIFNRFLTCPSCEFELGTDEPEPYDICMECYVMGRSCACISKLRWAEQFKWKELVSKYEAWRKVYIELSGGQKEDSPLPINEERAKSEKNTLAQICQAQLKKRPWNDIKKTQSVDQSKESDSNDNDEIEIGENGTVKAKPKKKNRSETWLKNNKACHVCAHRHPRWKMAECPCGRNWCFGALFRAHDLMPQQILESPEGTWKCPHCQGICSAGHCRKDPRQKSYKPKGTLLGHDTRKVADVRSVESLVDFSVSNLTWLKESPQTPTDSERLRKHQEEAEIAKMNDPALDAVHYDTDENENGNDSTDRRVYNPTYISIDPALNSAHDQRTDSLNTLDSSADASLFETSKVTDSNSLVPVALMLDQRSQSQGTVSGEYADYRPAVQEYVAPTAVMVCPLGDRNDAEPGHDPETAISTNKRKIGNDETINTFPRKQSKKQRQEAANEATKQYRRDQEKKALDEARRTGHLVSTSAALRGQSKILQIRLSPDKLRGIRQRFEQSNDNVLLQSDIVTPIEKPASTKEQRPTKPMKHIRMRTEKDETFSTRKDRRQSVKRNGEEEDMADFQSDSDVDNYAPGIPQLDGALEVTDTGDKKRRISSWQQRKALDDNGSTGSFTAVNGGAMRSFAGKRLPIGGKKIVSTKRQHAGKSIPKLRPSAGPARAVIDNLDSEEEDDSSAATQQAERKRKAQAALDALQERDADARGDNKADQDDKTAEEEQEGEEYEDEFSGVKPVAPANVSSQSIFTKLRANGKPGNIRIVSGRRKTSGPGGVGTLREQTHGVRLADSSP